MVYRREGERERESKMYMKMYNKKLNKYYIKSKKIKQKYDL